VAAFTFEGNVTLAELETAYGLKLPDDLRGLTVAEAFRLRDEDRINIGDRIQLGPAALTVTELDGDMVRAASLEIDEVELPEPSADRLFSAWLKRRIDAVAARLGS
jgi:NhaP-type Na+/H+ and K+/H+ antiporter